MYDQPHQVAALILRFINKYGAFGRTQLQGGQQLSTPLAAVDTSRSCQQLQVAKQLLTPLAAVNTFSLRFSCQQSTPLGLEPAVNTSRLRTNFQQLQVQKQLSAALGWKVAVNPSSSCQQIQVGKQLTTPLDLKLLSTSLGLEASVNTSRLGSSCQQL